MRPAALHGVAREGSIMAHQCRRALSSPVRGRMSGASPLPSTAPSFATILCEASGLVEERWATSADRRDTLQSRGPDALSAAPAVKAGRQPSHAESPGARPSVQGWGAHGAKPGRIEERDALPETRRGGRLPREGSSDACPARRGRGAARAQGAPPHTAGAASESCESLRASHAPGNAGQRGKREPREPKGSRLPGMLPGRGRKRELRA